MAKKQGTDFSMSDQRATRFYGMKNQHLVAALLLAIFTVMLGVGIDVSAWQWDVAARTALAGEIAADTSRPNLFSRTSTSIRIGVLAHKGMDICVKMWQPTMVYLNKVLPGRQFDLAPLQYEEIESAVRNRSIDFLICNPAIYVDLEVRYGVTRTMTLRNLVGTQIVSEFGGVVFCRADRSDLHDLRDVRGQRLAATDQTSFGGWYMALREFRAIGIDPVRDSAGLVFLDTHPAVVRAVLSGDADIGTVRTDTIERMAVDGDILMDEIRVISADFTPGSRSTFPYLHSTRLYPEWPFAKLSDTNEELSRELTVALLGMPADSPAAKAAQSGGWGICLDYTSVHDCLRELRLPPYQHYGQLSWSDLWRYYWQWLAAIAALIIALLLALLLLRSRQLAAMKSLSSHQEALLLAIPDIIMEVDANMVYTWANRIGMEFFGEDVIGREASYYFEGEQDTYQVLYPLLRGEEDVIFVRSWQRRKDGQKRLLAWLCRVLKDSDGNVTGAISSARDITERMQVVEEKDALQLQLMQAQKMESVGRLAGGVAHDCNNMLSAILGHAELAMMRCKPSEPIHANLKVIEDAARRSADLTRQLLAFARKQTVAPVVLDVNETVSDMLKMLRRLIGEDIDVVWIPEAGLWQVKIDPSQIDQILANLCVNARDAIIGVGKVTIETKNTTFDEAYCAVHLGFACGEYVMLAVSDNGRGICKEDIDNIFEPFFTTKELGKGTGLGLATVYGIAKQNDGFVNVYSEPDKGTTLRIYLPRFVGEAMESSEKGTEEIPKGSGETVLLVEDEPVILDVSREMLEQLGYTVLSAGTPGEALHQANAHATEIKLLITDVIMPEMNGRDLAKLLSDIKPGLKCLFVSGYTANVIAHHGVLEEGVCFLQKPFSMKDLASRVRQALK
jgi:PAS domain S-box-containing protein